MMKTGSLRVLLWTDSDRFAGTERHCLDLAGGLQRSGVEVSLGCRPQTPLAFRAFAEGLRVVELDTRWGGIRAVSRLRGLLRNGSTDLVHVHNGKCALLARIALARAGRGTLVATQHFITPARTSRRGVSARVAARAHEWVDRGISRWVAISAAVGDAMVQRRDTTQKKVRLVFNGVPGGAPGEMDRALARSVLGLPPEVPILLCVARLEPEKGHGLLLHALKMLSRERVEFLTLCVGEGSLEGAIARRIGELAISERVRMVGQQPDVSVWLRAADVLVLPSPAEPFGLVLLEAMCRGVPVVAAAAGGPLEILRDGGGLLFTSGDPRDLGEKLLRLLSQTGLRRDLADAARLRWATHFSVERMAQQMCEVYQEATGVGRDGEGDLFCSGHGVEGL
jgi:glycosyltransferase involved in cell wall biosynthesis